MTASNAAWRARSLRAVWHPCTQMKAHGAPDGPQADATPLIAVASAEGPWLVDVEGRRYLDGISSWWTNLFGHGHPAIRAALVDQLSRLDHTMLAGLTHAPVVELSERLAALTGLGHAFYASDGASATEIALKMSAHHWRNAGRPGKNRFVALQGGYHGETAGALGVTDIALFREAYAPLVRLSATVTSPDARGAQGGETAADVALRAARDLEAWLERHHEETAAFIVEPLVQCATGMAMHDPAYLRAARALCDRFGVHLVVDEIAVGFGRTGTMFAHQQAGIRPDFICLSKGLTGGTLPLATLDLFEREDALAANRGRAAMTDAALAPLYAHPRVRHARRLGMIWAWDIADAPANFARRYARHALAHGLLLRPIGATLYAMPPYVLDQDTARHLADGALAALEATLAEDSPSPSGDERPLP